MSLKSPHQREQQALLDVDDRAIQRMSAFLADAPPVYSEPSGPFLNCFSAEKVVNLFFSGASEEDFQHLIFCHFCHLRTTRYAEFTRQSLPSPGPEGPWRRLLQWAGFRSNPGEGTQVGSALLRVAEPTIMVSDVDLEGGLAFTCDLISGLGEPWAAIDANSIVLAGPVTAVAPQIQILDIQGRQIVRFSFHDARVADYIKHSLQTHGGRLSDTITLKGANVQPGGPPLLGKATVVIEKT
jgi:hypothetical protein